MTTVPGTEWVQDPREKRDRSKPEPSALDLDWPFNCDPTEDICLIGKHRDADQQGEDILIPEKQPLDHPLYSISYKTLEQKKSDKPLQYELEFFCHHTRRPDLPDFSLATLKYDSKPERYDWTIRNPHTQKPVIETSGWRFHYGTLVHEAFYWPFLEKFRGTPKFRWVAQQGTEHLARHAELYPEDHLYQPKHLLATVVTESSDWHNNLKIWIPMRAVLEANGQEAQRTRLDEIVLVTYAYVFGKKNAHYGPGSGTNSDGSTGVILATSAVVSSFS